MKRKDNKGVPEYTGKGRKPRKAIVQIKNGRIIRVWASIYFMCKACRYDRSTVAKVLAKKVSHKTVKGFELDYKREFVPLEEHVPGRNYMALLKKWAKKEGVEFGADDVEKVVTQEQHINNIIHTIKRLKSRIENLKAKLPEGYIYNGETDTVTATEAV